MLRGQPQLAQLWADGGDAGGTLAEDLRAQAAHPGLRLDIVQRSDPAPPKASKSSPSAGLIRFAHPSGWPSAQSVSLRSAVERTFGRLMLARRLAPAYETKTTSSEAMIFIQAARIMLRRLAK